MRFLTDVASVNSFEVVPALEIASGDGQTIYFQLIDASLDRAEQGYYPSGRRYVPATGATLKVTLININDDKKIVRVAAQPYASDPSIWSIPILSSDPVAGTASLNFELKEPTRTLNARFNAGSLLRVR